MLRKLGSIGLSLAYLVAPTPAPAQAAPAPATGSTPPASTEPRAGKQSEVEAVPVLGKWSPRFYGFVEADFIYDTTESLNDIAGNTPIAHSGTYAADHRRMQFDVRNTRFGFKLSSPEDEEIRGTALIEGDFLGNQPTDATESSFFNNPTFRIRHAWLKLETPFVDVLFGQYWQLFGWQPYFHPNTVEIQGLPGEVYSRVTQLRLSHVFKSDAVNVEVAIAAAKPPQRDAGLPDGQAGLRMLVNHWKGLRTIGATGTSIDSLGIGVSAALRRFAVKNFSANPTYQVTATGWGISADLLLPILAADVGDRGNALTLTGSYARGNGDADFYTALTGGLTFPALPNPAGTMPPPVYAPNIDNGLVAFEPDGSLQPITWQSFIVGLQYYLPPSGSVWISANYSHANSPNISDFATPNRVYRLSNWFDACLFWDATRAARFGLEYAWTEQTYVDDDKAHNSRVQFSAFYIF